MAKRIVELESLPAHEWMLLQEQAGRLVTETVYDHDSRTLRLAFSDHRWWEIDGKLYREDEPVPEAGIPGGVAQGLLPIEIIAARNP